MMLNACEHFIQQRTKNKLELNARGHFPILFSLLDRQTKTHQKPRATWQEQDWSYDVIDKTLEKIDGKSFLVFDAERLSFRKYFFPLAPGEKKKSVPIMSGAVIPCSGQSRTGGKVSTDFVGSFCLYHFDFHGMHMCYLQSALSASHEVCITPQNYKGTLIGFALYKSVKYVWTRHEDIFYAPHRDLTPTEQADCLLYALLDGKNNTATTTVEIKGEKFILQNWFNPFDEAKFDWSKLSKIGKSALSELMNYCENLVRWRTLQTPYGNNKGNGIWMGLYQYRTTYDTVNKTYKKKFGKDYPNLDLYGFSYPDSFKQAIENLRQRIEALAIDLCLSAGKEITRTRDTFLEQSQRQPNLTENGATESP
jgi:hypothetical protein